MSRLGVKKFSLSVLAGVTIGIILQLFIPGIPNIGKMIYESRIRGDMMRELKLEAEHNRKVFFTAMNNEERVKKAMNMETAMTADNTSLQALLNNKRECFEIEDEEIWKKLKGYYDETTKFNTVNQGLEKNYAGKKDSKLIAGYKKTYGQYLDVLNKEYEAVLETAVKNRNNFKFSTSALPRSDRSLGLLAGKLMMYEVMVTFENMDKSVAR